jgi:hypothetical protein
MYAVDLKTRRKTDKRTVVCEYGITVLAVARE